MNNYKKCPLKKRPVFYEDVTIESSPIVEDQPQDLTIKRKAEDKCQSEAKRNFALNLTVNSVYDSIRSGNNSTYARPESPISVSSESSSHYSQMDNSLSPSSSDTEYQHIHLRGLSPSSNSYSGGFMPYSPLTAIWNGVNLAQQVISPPPHSVYSYHMTPPSSPGSYSSSSSSSEPEDLSIRNYIPLPALFHNFDEAPSAGSAQLNAKNFRYKCEKCSKMYSTSIGLSKHQQYHCPAAECNQEKKHHACHECGKPYTTLGALKMHIRTHTLPCKCPICGKAFSRPWLLQGHIRTHTGEKPFSCSDCNRSFADRSNLRAHQQTHVEVKKYACKVCRKSFSRMSLLNKHANSNCTITIA